MSAAVSTVASSEAELLRLVRHRLEEEQRMRVPVTGARPALEVVTHRRFGVTSWRVGLVWPQSTGGAPYRPGED